MPTTIPPTHRPKRVKWTAELRFRPPPSTHLGRRLARQSRRHEVAGVQPLVGHGQPPGAQDRVLSLLFFPLSLILAYAVEDRPRPAYG
jgi:hypothetical protein